MAKVWGWITTIAILFVLVAVFPVIWEIPFSRSPTQALHSAPYDMVRAIGHNTRETWNWLAKVSQPANSGIAQSVKRATGG